ncbi:MAG: CopD family protein [Actinomycetota bacterium]|nr:CopD family protein [Actinomycetota bacterium]
MEEILRDVAFAVARFGAFAAHAFLFGLPIILIFVLRPALASAEGDWAGTRDRLGRRLQALVGSALWASALVTTIALLLQALLIAKLSRRGDLEFDVFSSVVESSFGRWHFLRFPLLVSLVVILAGKVRLLALAGTRSDEKSPGAAWWIGWCGVAFALLATSSLSGHAASSSLAPLTVPNDILHLAAGSIWFSGIVLLSAVLPRGLRALDDRRRLELLAPSVVRFSQVAGISIVVIAGTGTLNSLVNVAAVSNLVDSTYGRVLSFKIVVFVVVVALGTTNHFFLRAKLRRALEEDRPTPSQNTFRRIVAVELTLGLTLMGLTGVLAGSQRTRKSAAPIQAVKSAEFSERFLRPLRAGPEGLAPGAG